MLTRALTLENSFVATTGKLLSENKHILRYKIAKINQSWWFPSLSLNVSPGIKLKLSPHKK